MRPIIPARSPRTISGLWAGALGVTSLAAPAFAGFTPPDFEYVRFRIDTAELTARRNIGAVFVNSVVLKDANVVGVPDADLSDALFGAMNAAPLISQGARVTGITEVDVPQYFWVAVEAGRLTLSATFTDTNDATFAIDFISLVIKPTGGAVFEKTYGSHASTKNNGFGLGIADGAMLPSPLPGALAFTGTGFDETVSSKSIFAEWFIPAPGTVLLGVLGVARIALRRRRAS